MKTYSGIPVLFDHIKDEPNVFSDLERLFHSSLHSPFNEEKDMNSNIHCQEHDNFFKVSLDVPGIDPKTINIKIQDDSLLISSSEEKTENKEDEHTYQKRSLKTSIALPLNVNRSSIEANCENGVLELVLPKKTQDKAISISVQSDSSKRFIENIKKRFTKKH